jgi:hypothetical protein
VLVVVVPFPQVARYGQVIVVAGYVVEKVNREYGNVV